MQMANDDPEFQERFSELSNSVQAALNMARQYAIDARLDLQRADGIYLALQRAAAAVQALRPGDGQEEGGNG
jgi:hypothetical protein